MKTQYHPREWVDLFRSSLQRGQGSTEYHPREWVDSSDPFYGEATSWDFTIFTVDRYLERSLVTLEEDVNKTAHFRGWYFETSCS